MGNRLSKRLETVVSFVDKGSYPADIGSDHALVPIALVSRGIVEKVFAVENKIGPFERMKKEVSNSGFLSQIECSFSSGLSSLPSDVNELIVAGMGGELISSIILANKEKMSQISYAIIDAHREYPILLKTLGELGFLAVDDYFFYDKGKPYCVYRFKNIGQKVVYSKKELLFGPLEIVRKSKDWLEFYQLRLKSKEAILNRPDLPLNTKKEIEEEIESIKDAILH